MKFCKNCKHFIRVGYDPKNVCLHNAPEGSIVRDVVDGYLRYNTTMLNNPYLYRKEGCGEDAKFYEEERLWKLIVG